MSLLSRTLVQRGVRQELRLGHTRTGIRLLKAARAQFDALAINLAGDSEATADYQALHRLAIDLETVLLRADGLEQRFERGREVGDGSFHTAHQA